MVSPSSLVSKHDLSIIHGRTQVSRQILNYAFVMPAWLLRMTDDRDSNSVLSRIVKYYLTPNKCKNLIKIRSLLVCLSVLVAFKITKVEIFLHYYMYYQFLRWFRIPVQSSRHGSTDTFMWKTGTQGQVSASDLHRFASDFYPRANKKCSNSIKLPNDQPQLPVPFPILRHFALIFKSCCFDFDFFLKVLFSVASNANVLRASSRVPTPRTSFVGEE